MKITLITSTDLKNRLGQWLHKSALAPIGITKHGETTHVLMSKEKFDELTKKTPTDQSANSDQQD